MLVRKAIAFGIHVAPLLSRVGGIILHYNLMNYIRLFFVALPEGPSYSLLVLHTWPTGTRPSSNESLSSAMGIMSEKAMSQHIKI